MAVKNHKQDGEPFDYGDTRSDGQHENYPVNIDGELVAPVRHSYVHNTCGRATTIPLEIAITYAKKPRYYGTTFCTFCREHLPVGDFVWSEDGVALGEIGPSADKEIAIEIEGGDAE